MIVSVFQSSVRAYSGSAGLAAWVPAGFGELQLMTSNAGKMIYRNLFMIGWYYVFVSYKVREKN
jgi:hypothetical protein